MVTNKQYIIVRLLVWAIPVVLLCWILQKNLAPFGRLTLSCSPQRCNSGLVESFSGSDDRGGGQNNQFNIDVKLWRPMQQATISVTYTKPSKQQRLLVNTSYPGIAGSRTDELGRYSPETSYADWSWQSQHDLTLLTRRNPGSVATYRNIDDFLKNLPDTSSIATYNVNIPRLANVSAEQAFPYLQDEVTIRGSHDVLVYVRQGDPFDVTVTLQDINRHNGGDGVRFDIYRGDTLLTSAVSNDDGNRGNNGIPSSRSPFRIFIPDVSPGVYRIAIVTRKDDPFIRTIASRSNKMMFSKKLYLAGSDEYRILGNITARPTTVYVRGKTLTATTAHTNAYQTIKVGSQKLRIRERHTPYTISLPDTGRLIKITVPVPDVRLETDGIFVLSPDHWFSSLAEATPITDLREVDRYNYILASGIKYPDDRKKSMITQKSIALMTDSRSVHLTVVAEPFGSNNNERVEIQKVRVTFHGEALTPVKIFHWSELLAGVRKILAKNFIWKILS